MIMKNIPILIIFLLSVNPYHVTGSDFASYGYANGAAEYLKIPRHALSAGLANAVTAWQEELAGVQYNPAILDMVKNENIPIIVTNSFMSLDRKQFGLDAALGIGDFIVTGISFTTFGVDNIEGRDSLGNLNGSFNYGTNTVAVSIAGRIKWQISWGVRIRYIHENLADEKAHGLGFDFGAVYSPLEQLTIGISGQNILSHIWWSTGHDDPILPTARLGLASRFLDSTLMFELDIAKSLKQPIDISLGAQYKFLKYLFFRTGISSSIYVKKKTYRNFDFSCGLGVRYKRYGLDYALPISSSQLGLTHKISIIFKLPSLFQ